MRGSSFGFIGFVVTLVLVGVAGVIGYNLGLGANVATTATDGATHVVYAPWGFGFGGFGLLFGILFFVLIISLIRRAAWGGGPRGYYGRGGWGSHGGWGHDHGHVPPQSDPAFDEWHRRAHGDTTGTGQTGGQPGTSDAGNSGTGAPGTRT